ncbi:hypothetical protein CGRA01v4_10400 [Colletotrichum graminicola]|nr:hypothetical protein CGRA01v4_10400 [Colletotrichum graminicola]
MRITLLFRFQRRRHFGLVASISII